MVFPGFLWVVHGFFMGSYRFFLVFRPLIFFELRAGGLGAGSLILKRAGSLRIFFRSRPLPCT